MIDRERQDSIADMIFQQAKAGQECYAAGVRAADDGPNARKLARLLTACTEAHDELRAMLDAGDRHPNVMLAFATLHSAIEDARR